MCDSSQPGGYCTIFGCGPNGCPDNAACVEFRPQVPGCPYDDYRSPSRTGRTFCLATCSGNADCRAGYECADPTGQPWSARILDTNQARSVCIVTPGADAGVEANPDASVCGAGGQSVPPIDAGVADAASADGDAAPIDAPGDAPGGG